MKIILCNQTMDYKVFYILKLHVSYFIGLTWSPCGSDSFKVFAHLPFCILPQPDLM